MVMQRTISSFVSRFFLTLLFVFTSTSFLASNTEAEEPKIPPMLQKKLRQEVFPQIFGRQPQLVNQQVSQLVTKSSPEMMDAIENAAVAEGYGSIEAAYLGALQSQLDATGLVPPKRPNHAVVGYLVPAAQEQMASFLASAEMTPLLVEKPSEDWKESRKFFNDTKIVHQLFQQQEMLGMFVGAVIDNTKKKDKALPELDPLFEKFSLTATEFVALKNKVLEREMKLRLERFNRSAAVVKQPGDFETRLTATMFLFEDQDALLGFLDSSVPKPYQTEALNEVDLAVKIKTAGDEILKSDRPVVTKAKLLTSALASWKMGRYGVAPLAGGLLKWDRNQSKQNGGQNGLRIPLSPNVIDEQGTQPYYPVYDRRHEYTWDIEERPLDSESQEGQKCKNEVTSVRPLSEISTSTMTCPKGTFTTTSRQIEQTSTYSNWQQTDYQTEFPPADETIPYRIVGTSEYASALDSIFKLTSISTKSEIGTYDNVIAEFPELSFYSGDAVAGNQGRKLRNSLAWLTALARVELASTRSLYGPGDDSFIPKSVNEFGLDEYLAVLLDDAAGHLNRLDADPEFGTALKKTLLKASSQTIAFLRRLKLIDNMLRAIEATGNNQFASMAKDYRKKVKDYKGALEAQVHASTGRSSAISGLNEKTSTFETQQILDIKRIK